MNSITKIILGLSGLLIIGLITFYIVSDNKKPTVTEKPVTTPTLDTIATVKVVKDTILDKIKNELKIDGEEFKITDEPGVYTNSSKDKLLVIKEDVWKKILKKVQKKFPNIADDCNSKYKMRNLSDYKFVGFLTYLAESNNIKTTSAYTAK